MANIVTVLNSGFLTPNIDNFTFVDSLIVMLRGMLSIFLVTGVLIVLVIILNRYSKKKKEKEERGK